jgi:uncharacterized protein with NRDE domain
MCTLAVLWKVSPVAPLVIAQCRDEALLRPALDVDKWKTGAGAGVVSGRDVLAGGTWFGVGPHVVAGLTNRRDELGPRRGTLSRGDLVVDALEAKSVADVARRFEGDAVVGGEYGPFCFLAVDDDAMFYAENSGPGGAVVSKRLREGVHILGNFGVDNADDAVVRTVGGAVRALVDDAGADEDELVRGLEQILARRGTGWPCVSLPDLIPGGYGTRSAGVLVLRPDRARSRLYTTEGAPDVTPWRDSSALLR